MLVQPGCPGRVLDRSGGTGHVPVWLQSPFFSRSVSDLVVCSGSWADSILRRSMYCLLRRINIKSWDLFILRKGSTREGFAAVVSLGSRTRCGSRTRLKTQRRVLGQSARALVAKRQHIPRCELFPPLLRPGCQVGGFSGR